MASLRYSLSLRERAGVRVVVDSGDEVKYRFHCYSPLLSFLLVMAAEPVAHGGEHFVREFRLVA